MKTLSHFRSAFLLALPLAGLPLAATEPLAPGLIFEEKDGVVAIEAEHFAQQEKTEVRAWHPVSTENVHTGVFGQIWIDILKPGLHKIHFSMREDGFEFDKFILTTTKPDQQSPPRGHGPPSRLKNGELPPPFKNQKDGAPKTAGRFPAHWGKPPRIQTRDLVDLPEPYGKGSSTLRNWIKKKQKDDATSLQKPRQENGDGAVTISDNPTQWQPVTLTLNGPYAHELDKEPNPFRDYSLVVTFTHSSGAPEYHVPGYFAADGRAAESSAQSGTKWRAHFSPDLPGEWTYHTTFLTGKDVALLTTGSFPEKAVETLANYSQSGTLTVKPTPQDAPGFYAEGRLTYVGKHHLQFAGSKRYFLKVGADSPETLLGYVDFDGTTASTRKVPLKTFAPHVRDWEKGDPTWQDGKGKGLIGALNYLSGKGMNAFSFLPYNAGGDGDNVWPFVSRDRKFHYDCSKLDQWNVVFTHAQAKGLFLHFKLQETEMDDNNAGHGKKKEGKVPTSLDGGDLGPERTLYCRELVARFGHHLALNWNLGEENTQTTKQQIAMARCLHGYDPYDHHLVVHTFPNQQDKVYRPLLGADSLTGVSLQNSNLKDVHWQTVKWRRASAQANLPWAIAFDEPGDATYGMPPDPDYPGMPKNDKIPTIDETRKWVLWGNLLGGGWGVEYYFGYKLPQNDLVCEDWRSRDQSWTYGKIALDFFRDQNIPFWEMTPNPELVRNPDKENQTYCLTGDDLYVLGFPDGGTCQLDLPGGKSFDTIQWFNPRTGTIGEKSPLTSPKITCPDKQDWIAIVRTK